MISSLQAITLTSLILDLRYTTDANFTGQKVFDRDQVLLESNVAQQFLAAVDDFDKQGYRVVVWDAYRSSEEQEKLLEVNNDARYVARESNHCKGTAVDMTLATKDGQYLDMGTDFDCFTEEAHANYPGLTSIQAKNRQLLTQTMERYGFGVHLYEWWHFDFAG